MMKMMKPKFSRSVLKGYNAHRWDWNLPDNPDTVLSFLKRHVHIELKTERGHHPERSIKPKKSKKAKKGCKKESCFKKGKKEGKEGKEGKKDKRQLPVLPC